VRGASAFAALARPRDFGGTRRRSGPLTVAFVPAVDGETPARPCVAFAIGRRVGPAVVRNRLRRRLRDELASLARDGRLTPGLHLIGVGPAAAGLDGPTLRGHLRAALGIEP